MNMIFFIINSFVLGLVSADCPSVVVTPAVPDSKAALTVNGQI